MKKTLIVLFGLTILAAPLFAFAQTDIENQLCLLLNRVKTILLVVGIGIAVILIIIAGIKYLTAGGNEENVKAARKMIINALIGVAIMMVALFLVAIVQGILTGSNLKNIFNPSPCIEVGERR